jgi:hypothetical protein
MAKKLDTKILEFHEKMAKDCFNKTWDLLDKSERNQEEENEMVHTAHASRYHWGVLVNNEKGTPVNLQRGEWQIAHVYTVIKRAEPALYHAKTCLRVTEDHDIGDFDLAFAYECMARAMALAKNKDDFERYFKLAKDASQKIKQKEDREFFLEELEKGSWFGMKK